MDKEKEQEIIEAAKLALKITGDLPPYPKTTLIQIHNSYLNYDEAFNKKMSEVPSMFLNGIEICKKFLRESTGNPLLRVSRKAVDNDLRSMKAVLLAGKLTGSYDEVLKLKRGRPIDERLYLYIFGMATWYVEFVGKPGYGINSIFTNFVSSCLSIIDEYYLNAPPIKQIKLVLKDFREKLPSGVKPSQLYI